MSKNKFYSVKYANNTGKLFNNIDDYKKGIKGQSGSSSRGFRNEEEAINWFGDIPYEIIENTQTTTTKRPKTKKMVGTKASNSKKIFAVARGRQVGIIEDKKIFKDSITGYKKPIYNCSCTTKIQAQRWLRRKGLSEKDEKGFYAIAVGHKLGVFTSLHTYEKNIMDYPCAIGRTDFATKEQALEWLDKQKNKKRYYVVAKGKRRGIYSDITKYQENISGIKEVIAKGGFKSKERAREWFEEATNKQKRYHAVAIGIRKGIYTDKKKFDYYLTGIKNSWGKDNFESREAAKKWLDDRTAFINKFKTNVYKEVIIAYESRELPVIYIDGSFLHEKKQYSSSVVICEKDGHIATFARASGEDKNNTDGEIEALLIALKLVVGLYDFKEFILVYDFNSLEKVARNQLKIKSVPSALQDQIVKIIKESELDIHFLNVKSHTGIIGNTVADQIARDIIDKLNKVEALRDLRFD